MMQYRHGTLAAFEQLYRRHKNPLYRYLLRGCGQAETAGELFQDVWASLVRARSSYQPRAKFTTWLYTLAHHRLIDHLRCLPRQPLSLSVDDDDETPTPAALWAAEHERPDAQAVAAEQRLNIRRALAALPIEQREAFLLHEEGGLTLDEIAVVSGVGRETVKSRLRYALVKLREALADV
jgi:RNA polymerase sigma-70 factor, ECF subfamily